MLELPGQLEGGEGGDAACSVLVSSVSRLLVRLLEYRATLRGQHNRDKRMTCTVNLLRWRKKISFCLKILSLESNFKIIFSIR